MELEIKNYVETKNQIIDQLKGVYKIFNKNNNKLKEYEKKMKKNNLEIDSNKFINDQNKNDAERNGKQKELDKLNADYKELEDNNSILKIRIMNLESKRDLKDDKKTILEGMIKDARDKNNNCDEDAKSIFNYKVANEDKITENTFTLIKSNQTFADVIRSHGEQVRNAKELDKTFNDFLKSRYYIYIMLMEKLIHFSQTDIEEIANKPLAVNKMQHCDIKPENIIITGQSNVLLFSADAISAYRCTKTTPFYAAPELDFKRYLEYFTKMIDDEVNKVDNGSNSDLRDSEIEIDELSNELAVYEKKYKKKIEFLNNKFLTIKGPISVLQHLKNLREQTKIKNKIPLASSNEEKQILKNKFKEPKEIINENTKVSKDPKSFKPDENEMKKILKLAEDNLINKQYVKLAFKLGKIIEKIDILKKRFDENGPVANKAYIPFFVNKMCALVAAAHYILGENQFPDAYSVGMTIIFAELYILDNYNQHQDEKDKGKKVDHLMTLIKLKTAHSDYRFMSNDNVPDDATTVRISDADFENAFFDANFGGTVSLLNSLINIAKKLIQPDPLKRLTLEQARDALVREIPN